MAWQENHISQWDEILNMAGCIIAIISLILAIVVGMRMFNTITLRKVK